MFVVCVVFFFLFKQKTAYEVRSSDWSSDVCSSDLVRMYDLGEVDAYPDGFGASICWVSVNLSKVVHANLAGLKIALAPCMHHHRFPLVVAGIPDRKSVV